MTDNCHGASGPRALNSQNETIRIMEKRILIPTDFSKVYGTLHNKSLSCIMTKSIVFK